jgi:hypothetical protein
MPYSPILTGDRIGAPAIWTRTIVNQAQARTLGLIPATTSIISYPTTWHHNIPWKTLRESWNIIYTFFGVETIRKVFELYAASNGTVYQRDKLFRTLEGIKESIGPNRENSTSATCNLWMSRLSEDGGHLEHLEESKQMTADQRENLRSVIAWQKWNIVEGPKESIRVEDPGSDDFDDFRFIEPALYDRFQRTYLYFEALDGLVRRYRALDPKFCDLKLVFAAEEHLLNAALEKVHSVIYLPLVPFNPAHWKVVQYTGATAGVINGQNYSLVAKKNR